MTGAANINALLPPVVFHLATILGALLALLLVSRILRDPRMPAATMGWLLIILLAPFVGIPLYLFFGQRKIRHLLNRKGKMDFPDTPDTGHHPLNSLLVSLGIPSSSDGHRVVFHADGREAWDDLVSMLQNAHNSIDIAMFILAPDSVGEEILSILTQKARQGVKIRLLLDGVGSFALPKKRLRPLAKAGGDVAWFIPVLHRPLRGNMNLRNHRKIIIIDGDAVWTGGRNIERAYLGPHCPDNCWVDLSFVQQGPGVLTYRAIFEADWRFSKGLNPDFEMDFPPVRTYGQSRIQVTPSGPDVQDDPIYAAILSAFFEAKQRIMIATPYFVPDNSAQEALRLAALRGVEVDLLMPEKSNHRLADIARRRYLRELVDAGVRLWLIPDAMVHAKAIVIDDDFAMAGSANMDIRSLFLNCEVMSCFYSKSDVRWLAKWMNGLMTRAKQHQPVAANAFQQTLEGLVLLGAYQL